ncbi:hypothetical protein ACLI1A_14195 [Flavobacterium sp. RHBU_3]|uniref:DUF7683 domain-containing protein n=1 Tax=Flavobacterium sp. RHBU_3 TaxID=3391184 RepID=UPI003984E39A
MSKYTRENLERIETYIEVAYPDGDEILEEYDISYVSLENLLKVFIPEPEDDYELVWAYAINKEQSVLLNSFLKEPLDFDFTKFEYGMQRYGVYK